MPGKVTWWEQAIARRAAEADTADSGDSNGGDGGELGRPPDSATVAEWREYAEAVGVDLTGATTKAAIIAAVDEAGS